MNKRFAIMAFLFILLAVPPAVLSQHTYSTGATYDELGQLSQFVFSDGSWVEYIYDNEVSVASQVIYHDAGGQTNTLIQDIDLNASGLMTRVVTDGGQKTYTYDSLSRLTAMRFDYGDVTRYHASDITYNHLGGLKSLSRLDDSINAAISYGYTEQGQLRTFTLGGVTATYRYDARGNLTAVQGFTSGDLHVPNHAAGAQAFDAGNRREDWEYDDAGRLVRDDRHRYYYDATGRLAMVRDLATGLPLQTNLYDAAGHRVRRSDILAGSVTYTVRDANGAVVTEIEDRSDGPDRTTNYVQHQGGTIAKVTRTAGAANTQTTQIVTDHLGSPAVTVTAGAVTHYEYGPFGVQLVLPEHAGARGYTGHEDDAALGLTYMMARHYDGAMARFLTPDPARDFRAHIPASYNLYQYTANDPINSWDPDGEMAIPTLVFWYLGNQRDPAQEAIDYHANRIVNLFTTDPWLNLWGPGLAINLNEARRSLHTIAGAKIWPEDFRGNGEALVPVAPEFLVFGLFKPRMAMPRTPPKVIKYEKHHTVPTEVLKQLPEEIANHPLIRGRKGAPNRWPIPEHLHKAIHKGAGGGPYNETFKLRVREIERTRALTVGDVLRIREDLVEQFGLGAYRP